MKNLIGSAILFCLLSLSALAQSGKPAKIYFFNGRAGLTIELKLATATTETISVRSRSWITVETTSDSLGFFVKDKPYFVHFEPGKSYYFMAQAGYYSHTIITEETERAFMMTLSVNSARGPEEYKLSKLTN